MIRFTKAKTIAAAVGTLATTVALVFADDVLNVSETGELVTGLILAATTIYAVFQTPNKPLPPKNTDEAPRV